MRDAPSPVLTDPIFGRSRPDGEDPHHCSKCMRVIDEDEVPFMLFRNSVAGVALWVYCKDCTDAMATHLLPSRGPQLEP
jgi:hypothetical protein